MIFSRFLRKFAAVTAVLGLIFAQLMVAAYACPMVATAAEARAYIAAEASADVGASSMICDPGSTMQDGLCKAHCQGEQENISALAAPATDFIPAFIVRLTAPQLAQHGADSAAINTATPHHSPPILLRNACLRI